MHLKRDIFSRIQIFFSVVPDAPEAPMVSEIFKDTALVTWQPPMNDGGSPVTGYQLERMTDVGNKWIRVTKSPVKETSLRMDDLQEGTNYQYRVIAENKAGPGKPSAPSEPFAAKDPWGNMNSFFFFFLLFFFFSVV